jgi:hypothetical protein
VSTGAGGGAWLTSKLLLLLSMKDITFSLTPAFFNSMMLSALRLYVARLAVI